LAPSKISALATTLGAITRRLKPASMWLRVETIRIDTWLWAARLFKTRTAATAAVLGGHVRVNAERVKAAKNVGPADIVEVRMGETRRTLVVICVARKRGSAKVAATLYEETPESIAGRKRRAEESRLTGPVGFEPGPRPTKRARRRLEGLRRSHQGDRRGGG
jgi:ribosome-associated heat shock protein Hsp15